MAKYFTRMILSVVLTCLFANARHAAASFYEGKTIKLIVGFSAGGGFDTYSRLIARHLGRHIAGNPAIVVENMTGAASLLAANHVYKVAKPDGLAALKRPIQLVAGYRGTAEVRLVNPLTGEEIEKIVLQLFKIEPTVVSQLNEILNRQKCVSV